MSLTLICPTCSKSLTYKERPIQKCYECGTEFPDELKATANKDFQTKRPTLLTILMGLCVFSSVIMLLIAGLSIFVTSGTYELNGEEVSREEFIRRGIPQILVVMTLFMTVSFGIIKEKPWSRYAVLALFAIPYPFWIVDAIKIGGNAISAIVPILLFYSVFFGLVYYYLFKRKKAIAYYNDLKYISNQSAHTTPASAPR